MLLVYHKVHLHDPCHPLRAWPGLESIKKVHIQHCFFTGNIQTATRLNHGLDHTQVLLSNPGNERPPYRPCKLKEDGFAVFPGILAMVSPVECFVPGLTDYGQGGPKCIICRSSNQFHHHEPTPSIVMP